MLEYTVSAQRRDSAGSRAATREAVLEMDTSLAGRVDAFNPVELLLASLAACMIKGVERAAPLLKFEYSTVEVHLRATRQDAPPKLVSIHYELLVGTQESDRHLELLHTNVRKYGTISGTLADAVDLTGSIVRAA